jgi:hypothetical protein
LGDDWLSADLLFTISRGLDSWLKPAGFWLVDQLQKLIPVVSNVSFRHSMFGPLVAFATLGRSAANQATRLSNQTPLTPEYMRH